MKIKLDENIPQDLEATLQALGHDTDTVLGERLTGRSDDAVFAAAQSESRFLVTQDLDFSDIRRFAPGSHAGILLLRLMNPDRVTLLTRILSLFREEQIEAWSGCLVVATDKKIRVARPLDK